MPDLSLSQALSELPDTPDGIADRMRALGIKGERVSVTRCPVAKYLTGLGFKGVVVNQYYVRTGPPEEAVPTPPALAGFIQRLLDGVYLDLVEVPDA
jgi:hypothetical protein